MFELNILYNIAFEISHSTTLRFSNFLKIYLFLGPLVCIGQKEFTDPLPLNKMVMKQWTVDDGLVSNNLTSVDQTDDGFIWITTFNGAIRFDGINFKLFDKENVDFLETTAFYSVTSGKDGVLLSSQGSGIIKYQDGQFSSLSEFNVSSVRKILIDSKGRYWCGTNNEGLIVKEGNTIRKVDYPAFNQVVILDIYEDSKGRVWIATEGKGLVYFENGKFQVYDTDALKDNSVTSILEFADGTIVLGTMDGACMLKDVNEKLVFIKGLKDVYVNDMVEDADGMLWLATERGLYRIHRETGYFEFINESSGLPANQISSIMIDHEESIWFSTKKAGLVRINVGSIVMLGESDGITSTRINIVKEHAGSMYIGSDDGSIFVKEGPSVMPINLSTKRRQIGVRDFMFEGTTLWIASYLGLHKYQNGSERIFTTNDGLSSNTIRKILKTKDNAIWLASRTGGVTKMKDERVTKIYNTDNGLNSNFILALAEDNDGKVVVGTHSGGISIIGQDTVRNFVPSLGGVVIFNIHIDELNRYWISCSNGVYLFQNGLFQELILDVDFKIEAVFDFVPDQAGNVWLTTINGIARISEDQLEDFANGLGTSVEGTIFDANDGMTIRECTGATQSTLMPDGSVYVPTINGVAIVNPARIRRNSKIPNVAITSFVVDGYVVPKNIETIDPGRLRYEFEFASASYLASDRVRYKYRLDGVNQDWISTKSQKIEYTNLSPGSYTFSVIGSNNDGVWNEKGDRLTFRVEPFYYQTLGFKILIVVLIILIFYFIFVWRVRRMKTINSELSKANEELDRFVYSASHDIRAPLTSILGAASIGKSQATVVEKDQCLDMIRVSAEKLDGFIRDIIDYSRNQRLDIVPEKVDLKEEMNSILESLRHLDEEGIVECNVVCNKDSFVTDVRRLRVVLKNIIANAFFYCDRKKGQLIINIDCSVKSSALTIAISDNGLGMRQEVLKNIFTMFYRGTTDSKGSGLGLYIAKENMEKLKGSIEVSSELHQGTTFTLTLPTMENYQTTFD